MTGAKALPADRAKDASKTNLINSKSAKSDLSAALRERITPEIVIGFVGPIASGVTTASVELEKLIAAEYGYAVKRIKLSDLIDANADRVGEQKAGATRGADRVEHLQKVGSALRRKFGAGYLAAKAIEIISVERGKSGYSDKELQNPQPRRIVHLIDSIKNEQEAEVLRLVYSSAFWLVGVFAPRPTRMQRLRTNGFSEAEAAAIMDRDEHDAPKHGQHVRETFFSSDYFIKNAGNAKSLLEPSVRRLLQAIFEDQIVTPTNDERGMAGAKQSAAASACLSRQVGAVIVSKEGSILGSGWNEVPKAGGGLYDGTGSHDGRCFKYGGTNCRNDERKDRLYSEVIKALAPHLAEGAQHASVESALRETSIKSLIEFSRAVHAEMAAIVDVARAGRGALSGGAMYVTTYPCHSCARHIIASGISRVVYIEPYPKSLALELHDDALIDGAIVSSGASKDRVVIEPFEGVGPSRFFSVFLMRDERKEGGKLKGRIPKEKLPADSESLDAFATLEKRVVQHIGQAESYTGNGDETQIGAEPAKGS